MREILSQILPFHGINCLNSSSRLIEFSTWRLALYIYIPQIDFGCTFAEPNQHIFGAVANKGNNAELDGTSAVSEVLQAEQIDGSDIIDKGPAEYVSTLFC